MWVGKQLPHKLRQRSPPEGMEGVVTGEGHVRGFIGASGAPFLHLCDFTCVQYLGIVQGFY